MVHDRRLTEMLEAETETKRMLVDPAVTELRLPFGFYSQQIGLQDCMCGPDGRIWRQSDRNCWTLVFDPAWIKTGEQK